RRIAAVATAAGIAGVGRATGAVDGASRSARGSRGHGGVAVAQPTGRGAGCVVSVAFEDGAVDAGQALGVDHPAVGFDGHSAGDAEGGAIPIPGQGLVGGPRYRSVGAISVEGVSGRTPGATT